MSDGSHRVTIPLAATGGKAWVVEARRFGCGEAARREWGRLNELCADGGDFSAWSVQVPTTGVWLVVVCATEEHLPTFYGVPYALDYANAVYFALRRTRVGLERELDPELGEYQRANYAAEGGRVIADDGTVRPPTTAERATGTRET